ncbi:MAG: pseudouridine synthase [Hahellaceae bacterium]|nr:pseudouridine synthase [Hahellaceae bacterium]
MPDIILFNKPFQVLSQFTDDRSDTDLPPRNTLAHYIHDKGYYPAGRLDYDSEGLLILTNDGKMQALISSPKFKQPKCYWAQVEGIPDETALRQLRTGVQLKDGLTLPALVEKIDEPSVWPRNPPIRYRADIPTQWIKLTIREGKNRQVRRMTAAIGHPTLRLIRCAIGHWTLDTLQPGETKKIALSKEECAKLFPPSSLATRDRNNRPSQKRPANTRRNSNNKGTSFK